MIKKQKEIQMLNRQNQIQIILADASNLAVSICCFLK